MAKGKPPTARPRGAPREKPGLRYIESSALAAALLERDAAALKSVRARSLRIASGVTIAETGRAILRAEAGGRVTTEQARSLVRALRRFERRTYLMPVTDAVLRRVQRRFPLEPVRTLDAVHLATAESLGESPHLITIVTRDGRVGDNARALGFAVE
ncbi:MAG: type II toxin-antitoxin system VapC family toxin [Vicinamibacterales bacterium]